MMGDKIKVHRLTVLVVDHDHLGANAVVEVLENQRYPNHCIGPDVLAIETQEVEWSDEHPLNYLSKRKQAVRELFDPDDGLDESS